MTEPAQQLLRLVRQAEVACQPFIDAREVRAGLRMRPPHLSPKYFYDEAGSRLFEEICRQPEYYLTRTELGIMEARVAEMARCIGPGVLLLEPGAGSGRKTRLLLQALEDPVAYVPVDISGEFLSDSAARLARTFPRLEVLPVCADFTGPFMLPEPDRPPRRRVAYFPGSTIGNFAPESGDRLLRSLRHHVGDGGGLLIGLDLIKPVAALEQAYNDAAGVTACFNLNVLERLNRELGADFDLQAFRHLAVYDRAKQRIEMRLVSLAPQSVTVAGERLRLEAGEYIVTEYSHKYTIGGFAERAAAAGFRLGQHWTDERARFAVLWLDAVQERLQP